MKTPRLVTFLLAIATISGTGPIPRIVAQTQTQPQAQTASELLQKGIYLQETVGDLDGAIKVYEQLDEESRSNAAQAEYRLGLCLLKKGQPDQAAKLFAKIIQQYPEQTEIVAKVRPLVELEPIVVWTVGDPYTGDTPGTTVPPDLEQSAEKIGRKLRILAFPGAGFTQTFLDAFAKNQEPDILVINNYGIILGLPAQTGILTEEAALPGIGSDARVKASLQKTTESLSKLGVWQFLFTTSKNYEAAKSLVLRSPECSLQGPWLPVPKELQTVAETTAAAYIEDKKLPFEDADRLNTDIAAPQSRVVTETKGCGYLGNDQLAFLPMISRYESPQALGWVNLLLILHKQENQWRLLVASTDPITKMEFLKQVPTLTSSIHEAGVSGKELSPAKLLVPEDGQSPKPAFGERFGNFIWQPSASADVVAEIAEFAYNNDARLFIEFRREDRPEKNQISGGKLWTTSRPWKWRVWSISDSGSISFSQARSFRH